jgi:rubrerythrin
MFIHNTNAIQQNIFDVNTYPLANATRRFLEEETTQGTLRQHWVCPGCGTTHADILPEECRSCGATGLEFQYSTPGKQEIRD